MRYLAVLAAAGLALAAVPTLAQSKSNAVTATAKDPAGIVRLLQQAGHTASLTTDDWGDPKIEMQLAGRSGAILFYDCDETTHDKCRSIQFSVGFDRAKPMPFSMLNDLVRSQRFMAMYLDDEGDPFMQWDIIMDEGIPSAVFLTAVKDFEGRVEYAANVIFAEERGQ
ncbi:YbjN domain-containing protein [Altererythrobacter xixiisoli]|uniref:YbjN domain-containing protein n=1 Tax=Croceibacterium xixiisoli TaxID=1476466 RepID=A0A6I4TV08_9SPHN|nr:YbjN domain-containing protein [Croceibacterium xixiisoli]MXO99050.1 YbjN domain-containing protein [Croceibacterium xixiisoli]